MDELKLRILTDGKNLGNGILKVDGFINHQVDPRLMDNCGQELARLFAHVGATKILTAEISGIAPAVATGLHLGLPVVYARKSKPVTMPDQIFLTLAPSHTKGRTVELIVSPDSPISLINVQRYPSSTPSPSAAVRVASRNPVATVSSAQIISK